MGAEYTGAATLTATSQKRVGGDTLPNVGVEYAVAPGMTVVLEVEAKRQVVHTHT